MGFGWTFFGSSGCLTGECPVRHMACLRKSAIILGCLNKKNPEGVSKWTEHEESHDRKLGMHALPVSA